MRKSMHLQYEVAPEPLHMDVNSLFQDWGSTLTQELFPDQQSRLRLERTCCFLVLESCPLKKLHILRATLNNAE